MKPGTCGACRHSRLEAAGNQQLQRTCRRNPPQVCAVQVPQQTLQGIQMNVTFAGVFPPVPDDGFCSLFEPALSSVQ